MNDYFGNKLHVGDNVVYIGEERNLTEGEILKVGTKKVTIAREIGRTYRDGYRVICMSKWQRGGMDGT